MIAVGMQSSTPGYYAMPAGIVTLYGRPFSKNELIGKLSHKLIPQEFEVLHVTLIDLRNKAFAHTDASDLLAGLEGACQGAPSRACWGAGSLLGASQRPWYPQYAWFHQVYRRLKLPDASRFPFFSFPLIRTGHFIKADFVLVDVTADKRGIAAAEVIPDAVT